MTQQTMIEHDGVVTTVNQGKMTVEITARSACSACHAKQHCMMADTQIKVVELKDDGRHRPGDKVVVVLEERQGFYAVFLGYIWPLIILITALGIGSRVFQNEIIAGLFSIAILAPYYLALYFFRDKIQQYFIFRLKSSL